MKYTKLSVLNPVSFVSAGLFTHSSGWIHSERIIDSYEIIVVTEGCLFIEEDSIKYEVREGNILLLRPGIVHRGWKSSETDLKFFWFHFLDSMTSEISDDELNRHIWPQTRNMDYSAQNYCILPTHMATDLNSELEIILHQMIHISRGSLASLKNYMMTIIIIMIDQLFLKTFESDNQHLKRDRVFYEILEWLKNHCTEHLSIPDVAARFHYNESYFSRMFKNLTGICYTDYINHLRIEKSKLMLYNSSATIKEIAFASGFNDEKYFMRIFKKSEGLSPSQYRHAFYLTHQNEE